MKKLIYLALVFAMFACQQVNEVIPEENKQYSPLPIVEYFHSDPMEMNELYDLYSESDSLLHYREARILAYADLLGGFKDFLNKEYDFKKIYLSQYPVVIFNYNNIPEYFEFTLYHDT